MIFGFLLAVVGLQHRTELNAILDDPRLTGATVSALVTDADENVMFERNSGVHVVPASNMKLFTAAFALRRLGPDWHPHTRVWKEAAQTFVQSTGDPMLSYDQLVGIRDRLGLDRHLPVYVSQPYAPLWPGGWEYGDLPNKYAAPITAFTVDRGSFRAVVKQGLVSFNPERFGTRVIVDPKFKSGFMRYDPFTQTLYSAVGGFPPEGISDTLSLPHPDEAAASLLGSGMVATTVVPMRPPDLDLAGPSTSEILRACLPSSDNQLAENLLLLGTLAAAPLGNDPYAVARQHLSDFATRTVGVLDGDLHVDDGCGLSRHDYVTTRGIVRLLVWSSRQPTAALWRDVLAHPGEGTLAKRLSSVPFTGKTGSMEMVASLSGYVDTPDHRPLVVSIVLNGFGCSGADAREIIDHFIATVASAPHR